MILEETARAQPADAGEHVRVEAANQDRLLSYGPFDYTYTANGELQTKTNRTTGEAWLFQYDALGNLLTVGLPNGDLIDYLVDGMGRRVGKKKNGVLLKQWIYRDALKPVAELDGSGALVSEFVYASKSTAPDYMRRGGNTYRVVSDQLGSPRYVVNVANASDVPFTASYTSFGVVTGTGLDWIPFGFAGGIYDFDTGLVRFGVRDYSPDVGRWLSKDGIRWRAHQTNLYVYVDNDPINRTDPSGQDWSPDPGPCVVELYVCIATCIDIETRAECAYACADAARDCDVLPDPDPTPDPDPNRQSCPPGERPYHHGQGMFSTSGCEPDPDLCPSGNCSCTEPCDPTITSCI